MADDDNENDSTDSTEGMVPRSQIKQLEKKASRVDDLETQLQQLQRKDAFREAGVDLADPKSKYFINGYDGEVDPEAIRKAAEEAGFITPPAPDPAQQQQLSAEDRLAQVSSAGTPIGAATEENIRAEMEKAMAEGGVPAMLAKAREFGAVMSDDLM